MSDIDPYYHNLSVNLMLDHEIVEDHKTNTVLMALIKEFNNISLTLEQIINKLDELEAKLNIDVDKENTIRRHYL